MEKVVLASFGAANVCFGFPAYKLASFQEGSLGWTVVKYNNRGRSDSEPKGFEFRFKPHCVLNAGSFSLIVIDTKAVRSCRSFPLVIDLMEKISKSCYSKDLPSRSYLESKQQKTQSP